MDPTVTKILLRATKSPFEVHSPLKTLDANLLAGDSGNRGFREVAWQLLSLPGV